MINRFFRKQLGEEEVVVCGVSRALDCNDVGLTPHIIRLYCVTL